MSSQALPAPAKQLFRHLFERASLGIAVEDVEGRLLLANPALCDMLGYTENELCRMHCSEFASSEDSQDDWVLFQKLRAGVIDTYSVDKRYVRKDGDHLWGHLNVSIMKDEDEKSPLILAFVENITERKLAEQEVARTNDRYRLAVEASKSVGWEWDVKSGRNSWFGDLQSMFGIPADTFVGHTEDFRRRVHPDDLKAVTKAVADARENRRPYTAEFRLIRLDGAVRWISASGKFYYGSACDAERMFGIAIDITEKRLTEESLRLFRRLMDECSDAIAVIDLKTMRFVDVNEGACHFLGYTRAELLTRKINDIDPSLDDQPLFAKYQEEIDKSGFVLFETIHRRKDGSTYPVEINLKRVELECVYYIAVIRDITERKRAEEALGESEQRLRLAVQAGRMYAFEWDVITDVIVRTGEFKHIFDWKSNPDRDTEREFYTRVHPDDRELYGAVENRLTPGSPTYQLTFRVMRPGSEVIWLNETGRAFFNEQGKMLRIIGMVADITQTKRAEETLRLREAELTEAQRLARVGSWWWDARTTTVIWSRELYNIVGRDPNLPAPPCEEHPTLFPAESWARLRRAVKECLQTGTPYELDVEILASESTTKWAIARGEPLRDAAGHIFGLRGTVQDITDRRQAEQALRESEERFRLATQAGRMFAYEWDAGTDVIVRAEERGEIFQIDALPLGTTGQQLLDKVHPDDKEQVLAAQDALTPEKPDLHVSHRISRPDGNTIWVERIGRAYFDEQGKLERIVGMVKDITERKLAETALANISRRLIEAQEQERARIGRELHDDIGQRLALVAVELQQLRDDPRVSSGVRNHIREIRKRVSEIAADTQSLSHELHSAKLQYLGISMAMRGFCREFSEQQKVEIDFEAHDLTTPIPAEVSLCLFRILQEALHNSAKHSGVRRFEVRLWGTLDAIHLAVRDSGVGFDREASKTSPGIGLISMEERLKIVNGTLSIDSDPSRGTTIEARVPMSLGGDSLQAVG